MIRAEWTGKHVLGRVLWFGDFLLWKKNGTSSTGFKSGYTGVGPTLICTGNSNPGIQYAPTTGTLLVLNFGEIIQLTEEYYAPSSLGTLNLQVTLQVQSDQNDTWTRDSYELVSILLNAGASAHERATS